ncbi:MAG: alanine--tRNA ligase [Flavobacteriales bacterium]
MNSAQIRQTFLDFFASKGHQIVPSAPMVIKNDPTLMFTNAGMNQFKDIFLGNVPVKYPRVADTQKCLRVSGKHNDLEEVGVDTYHHTMFEMLGNWSFGDYFKKEAIAWAWELLTEVFKIDKGRIYVTVFEGDNAENLPFDQEAYDTWKQFISEERILNGNKKDNFWEMGDTGPCGPCSEIHIDLRDDAERAKIDGKLLVNNDHPQVIEIWNNVFMEFNRKADGSLEKLPAQHVDTGMGFERLCMVLQGKQSNYDTDVFQPYIQFIEQASGKRYKENEQTDIAMRVIADHIRTIAFAIADGQLPSNNKAGYVIRRILRRAVRYAYTFLGFNEPFLFRLVQVMVGQMGDFFPEIKAQQTLIEQVIREEELSFLRTLATGINRFNEYTSKAAKQHVDGEFAFELFDTYGFPIDLTQLLAREKGLEVDMEGFEKNLQAQKERSRKASQVVAGDWVILHEGEDSRFIGYDATSANVQLMRYREIDQKGKKQYHLVFDVTPFYPEGGGQVGDSGYIQIGDEKITIYDTKKEHGLILHFSDRLPKDLEADFSANVDVQKRINTMRNHSATHLMHAALRKVLGTHVEQKGSLVNGDYLRFDFSHFSKLSPEEIIAIEQMVNEKIRENIHADIRQMAIEEAKAMGAMALFGEKYGDTVRVVSFDKDYSIELCGGTHVNATGSIGLFRILSESAVAAGVRRIEACTGSAAVELMLQDRNLITQISERLRNPKDLIKSLNQLLEEKEKLEQDVQELFHAKGQQIKYQLIQQVQPANGLNFIAERIDMPNAEVVKNIAFELRNQVENLVLVLGHESNGKPMITVALSDNLVKDKGMNAGTMVRELSKHIKGGGGGQPFYATAGGSDMNGLEQALKASGALLG